MLKRVLVGLLILCMAAGVISPCGTIYNAQAMELRVSEKHVEGGDKVKFAGGQIEITYTVTSIWTDFYNVNIELKNISDTTIHNWALLAYLDDNTITNIWNAKIANHNTDGIYLLDNNDWNMDIEPNQTVYFGYTASYKNSNAFLPKSFALTNCEKSVPKEDYEISYQVDSNGGGQLTAKVALKNISEKEICDWSLGFRYKNKIETMWYAKMETRTAEENSYSYYVRNPGWEQNIKSGSTYVLGFLSNNKYPDAEPADFEMKRYDNSIDYEVDSDGDGVNDVSEILCGANPYLTDTDGDGIDDDTEIFRLGLDPTKRDTDKNGVPDGKEDSDGDELANLYEIDHKLEPWNEDTDGDGLSDGAEVHQHQSNPLIEDTDGDSLSDGQDVMLGFSPLKKDTDGNGVTDDKELTRQHLQEDITEENENDGVITGVSLDMSCTGVISDNTEIENVYGEDVLSSEVEGLVGVPVNINSNAAFETATITFHYDRNKLDSTNEEDLAVMWYDEQNDDYVIYDDETVLNKEKQTISYTTTHFSTYLVVNKKKWYRIWRNEINYRTPAKKKEYVDVALTVDASGSMKGTEIKHAKKALEEFVNAKRGKDRCSVIRFTDTAEVLGGFTNSSKKIKKAIEEITAGGKTDVDKGVKKAIGQFTKSSYKDAGNEKAILLICDGDLEYNADIVKSAKENEIAIYTILVGDDNDDAALKKMSKETGGSFCIAKKAGDLSALIFGMEKEIMGAVNTKDTDEDGLYDVYETKGMLCSNGKIIKTDKNSSDTDRDGIDDYKEMGGLSNLFRRKVIHLKGTDEWIEAQYFSYRSDPRKDDTDNDEYVDSVDKRPKKKDVKLEGMKEDKDFLPVLLKEPWNGKWSSSDIAYGGNQGWWANQDERFSKGGCGMIAVANVLLYHSRNGAGLYVPINKKAYCGYTDGVRKYINYMPVIGGTIGLNIRNGINRYSKANYQTYETDLESSIFSKKNREKTLKRIVKESKKKRPVILSIGPKALGKVKEENQVLAYKKNDTTLISFSKVFTGYDPVTKEKRYLRINDHYVTVTGVIVNKQTDKIKFQISSWGKKYYIDYDEICKYVDEYGTSWTCDAVYVTK